MILDINSNSPPRLLVEPEPWGKAFLDNLRHWLRREVGQGGVAAAQGEFWPDVFVSQPVAWRRICESGLGHIAVGALALWLIQIWPHPVEARQRIPFDSASVIYYPVSEYLPPIDSGSRPAKAQRGDPEYAKQPIISVPPDADNRRQTIVTPPNVKLDQHVDLPNIVAWNPANVPVPMAATSRSTNQLTLPSLPVSPIAPAPEVRSISERAVPTMASEVIAPAPSIRATSGRQFASLEAGPVAPAPDIRAASRTAAMAALRTEVVAPAPNVSNPAVRTIGQMNIGHVEVVAPSPKLPVSEQRTLAGNGGHGLGFGTVVPPAPELPLSTQGMTVSRTGHGGVGLGKDAVIAPPPHIASVAGRSLAGAAGTGPLGAQVVPPPPSIGGATQSGGRLVALSVHPADVKGPIQVPQGNRRGSFAATPEGKAGATAAPTISANAGVTAGAGSGTGGHGNAAGVDEAAGLPPGIHVGGAGAADATIAGQPTTSNANSAVDPNLLASVTAPRVGVSTDHGPKPVDPSRATEVERKVFGIKRFYSMTANMPNLNSAGGSWIIRFAELNEKKEAGSLVAPVATQKVDPAYPIELMRQNVQGTVTLYAVIHADGSVGEVKVLNSVDERLDEYARSALSHWRFHPATRDGNPVPIEAVVMIPFRVPQTKF